MRQLRLRGEALHLAGAVVAIVALVACSSAPTTGGNPSTGEEDASNSPTNSNTNDAASTSGEDAEAVTEDAAAQGGSGSPSGSGSATANPVGGSGSSSGASSGSGSSGAASGSGVGSSGAATHDAGSGAKSGSASGSASGSSSGSGSSGTASSGSSSTAATFTMVYSKVLGAPTYNCKNCHGTDAPMLSFASQSTAYTDLVGVSAQGRSCATKSEKRVVASSSATSLLYKKLAGTQDCGSRMPESPFGAGTPVSASDLALVKSWIDGGALNN